MSEEENEGNGEFKLPVVVEIKGQHGPERFEVPNLLRLPRRSRIWAEKKTGTYIIDWWKDLQILVRSTEIATAVTALVLAGGRDEDPDDVFEDLLDRDDDYARLIIGVTAAELDAEDAGAGPTEGATGAKPKSRRAKAGTPAS